MRPVFGLLFALGGLPACEPRVVVNEGSSAPSGRVNTPAPLPAASASTPTPAAKSPPAPERLEAQVHLPAQLAAGQKAPLLLMLHSIGTSAEDIELRTDWPKFAAEQGIAWMAPNGPADSAGRRFWDAGPSCCNFSGHSLDHVSALAELLQRALRDNPALDSERVYIGGISNGGFMAHRFACESPDLVRGVVSISGAGPLDPAACRKPKHALRVLEVHGDADPIVAYRGGHFLNMPLLPEHASAARTLSDWAARLGCRGDAAPGQALNLEKRYPGEETRVSRYTDCALGAVELWTVAGGDHYLAFHDPAPGTIWQFLNQ